MFHVHFAVVAGEDDVGVVELAGGLQGVEDLAEHGVGFGDHGEVVAADGEDFFVSEVAVGVFGDAHVVHDGMEVGLVGRKGDVGGVDFVEPVLGGAEGGMGDVGAGVEEVGRVVCCVVVEELAGGVDLVPVALVGAGGVLAWV